MTTKERATLRSAAMSEKACCYIGKEGPTEPVIKGIGDALTARELIKISVQETCPMSTKEICDMLCGELGAQAVQLIGRKIIIYKRNKDIDRYGVL